MKIEQTSSGLTRAMVRAFKAVNMLSVDVALGAVVCSAFFAKALSTQIRPIGLLVLGLSVWVIYTTDHLLDARHMTTPPESGRHRLHQQYFKLLTTLAIVTSIGVAISVTQMLPAVVENGAKLAALVGLYLVAQRRLHFLKEISGAVLYTAGVLLIPLTRTTENVDLALILLIAQFGLTALNNLILFAIFDHDHDIEHKQYSLVTSIGVKGTKGVLVCSLLLTTALGCMTILIDNRLTIPATTILLMNLPLALIFIYSKYFKVNERYRLLGDLAFLFPLAFL